MPVDIAITTAAGEKIHRVQIDKREKEFTFEVDSKPLIVNSIGGITSSSE